VDVYINDVAAFLPNAVVGNDAIEAVLGRVADMPSRTRQIILRNNGIRQRHYAIDPVDGRQTHTNAQLTAEAVRRLAPHDGFTADRIACQCCGTTSPDLLLPGHALAVMGELALKPCEAVTTAGICIAGMTAFKYAWMNVASGAVPDAVATGSELASSFMRARFFTARPDPKADLERTPHLAFDADFLRWMLSDGAGAAYFSTRQDPRRRALRVDWVEIVSYAGQFETCMYAGGLKGPDGRMTGWRDASSPDEMLRENWLAVRQDTKLLGQEIVRTAMDLALAHVAARRALTPQAVDWFLPHYSSHYFRDKFYEGMKRIGFEIPYERWFTNLPSTGNTGSAAIYVILAELLHSGRLQQGQRLLLFVPESGRFSHCFAHLTVV
jgi:3-oxoacyl-[acyl-carrier-protein] synthase-3